PGQRRGWTQHSRGLGALAQHRWYRWRIHWSRRAVYGRRWLGEAARSEHQPHARPAVREEPDWVQLRGHSLRGPQPEDVDAIPRTRSGSEQRRRRVSDAGPGLVCQSAVALVRVVVQPKPVTQGDLQ